MTTSIINPFRIDSSQVGIVTALFYQRRLERGSILRDLTAATEWHLLWRNFDSVEVLAKALQGTEWGTAVSIGSYYRSVVFRVREGDIDGSEKLLTEYSAGLPSCYRSRALCSHGGIAEARGDRAEAARLYLESWRAGMKNDLCDVVSVLRAAAYLAYWRAVDGGRGQASASLQSLYDMMPVVKRASQSWPHLYFNHLDTTAFVAGMLGKWDEAKRMSDVAVTAPMINSYPNWRRHHEMFSRKASRRKSIIVLPAADRPMAPGSVINMAEWKDRRAVQPAGAAVTLSTPDEKRRAFVEWLIERRISPADASSIFCAAPWSAQMEAVIKLVFKYDQTLEPAMRAITRSGSPK
ncbi:MAG TPA: hypothetical protein VI756_13940 [Blastocatellia bacterium]